MTGRQVPTQGLELKEIMPAIPAKYSIVTPTPDAGQLNSHAFALDIHGLYMNIYRRHFRQSVVKMPFHPFYLHFILHNLHNLYIRLFYTHSLHTFFTLCFYSLYVFCVYFTTPSMC